MNWKYIVWHTAAHANRNGVVFDTTAKQIDEWHREFGWRKGGYNRVIRFNGDLDGNTNILRSYGESGAHVEGMNSKALGYCFSGHGDIQELTLAQLSTGLRITREDMEKYGIPAENVIGHNEVNDIVRRDNLKNVPSVNKSCPGKLVNMDGIRSILKGEDFDSVEYANFIPIAGKIYYTTSVDKEIKDRVIELQRFLKNVGAYKGKIDGIPGPKTSEASYRVLGFYLLNDPRRY